MPQLELNPGARPQRDLTPGHSLYPSPTAGRGTPDGRVDQEVFYSCQQCGFYCLQSRVQSPGGMNDGDGGVTVSVSAGVGNPSVSAGSCPGCGSANSRKQ